MSTKFTENRNLYHTFSRVAIQEGQGVAAAVNKTGHTVTTNDVWAEISKLPKNTTYFGNANTAFDDLKTVYDNNSTEFSKYVKLYENVELSPVDGSGQDANKNQAWELLVDGKRVKNFVAPTDVFDNNGQPCNGYTLQLFDKNGTQIPATDGNWAFDYVAGLVIFERGKTPQDMGWAGTATGSYIKMSAWSYIGEYLNETLDSHDSRLDVVEAQLGLGGNDGGDNGSLTERVEELEATVSAYTSSNTISSAITGISSVVEGLEISGSDAITVSPNKLTETPVISLKVAEGSNAIDITESGLSSFLEFGKDGSTITLKANGNTIGSFNLDLDRVVTSGAYIPSSEVLKLSFTSGDDVEIPVSALVDEYSAGAAISITDVVDGKNVISVVPGSAISVDNNKVDVLASKGITLSGNAVEVGKSANSEDFFFVEESAVGVSGVQAAIDLAAGAIISGVTEIPESTEGFKYNTLVYTADGETAIIDVKNNKVVDISEENVGEITSSSPSDALTTVAAVTGYVEEATSGILPDAKKYADDNFLKGVNAGNGIEVSAKANNTQTISILPDPAAGNLVQVTQAGIYVSASEYELPVADVNKLGGILEGNDLLIDQTGLVTVLSANQVKHDLKFGGKIFNGSAEQEILASDLGALTSVSGSDAISVTTKANDSQSISLIVPETEKYLEITSSGLMTKGIDEAITGYVNPQIELLVKAISDEATAREDADEFISGSVDYVSGVLKGYTTEGAVKAADDALDIRLDAVEAQLGLSDGDDNGGSVTEQIAFISGVLKDYTTVGSVSGAIKAEESARVAADNYISGVLKGYTAEGAVKAADDAEATARAAADNYISGVLEGYTAKGAVKDADDALAGRITTLESFKSNIKIQRAVTAEEGFAASYRLTTDGTTQLGDVINIPRDQFLSGAMYDTTDQSLKLTFALNGIDSNGFPTVSSHVATIPVGDLVDEYSAGSGIQFKTSDGKNTFNLVKDANADSKFLVIGNDTIGLSGISDAISEVSEQVTENINPAITFISGVLSGYSEVSAVKDADDALAEKITTLEANDQTEGSIKYAIRTEAQFADYTANGTAEEGTIQYAIRTNTSAITKNASDIAILNSDKTVSGSVDYKIDQYDQNISELINTINEFNSNIVINKGEAEA